MAVPAHKHILHLATAPRDPADPNRRDLMACGVAGCIHTEIVCSDCVAEGRKESIPGSHTHAPDGAITRALSSLPEVKPIRPAGWEPPYTPPKRRGASK